MTFEDKRSDIWHAVIPALREGPVTVEGVCEETGYFQGTVVSVLRMMEEGGWVEWPRGADEIRPGDAAKEFLRPEGEVSPVG